MSKGIVLELQEDCLDRSTSVADILRKAKTIAFKLQLDDLTSWIEHELHGYTCLPNELPSYRKAQGYPKFYNPHYGWCPLQTNGDTFGEIMRSVFLFESVSEIEHLIAGTDKGMLATNLLPQVEKEVQKQLPFHTETTLQFPTTVAIGVLDFARNKALEWALSLEQQGIIGDGMSFAKSQIEEANIVTNNIYGGNVGVMGNVAGDVENSEFSNVSNGNDLARVLELVTQIRQSLGGLPERLQSEIGQIVDEIEQEAEAPSTTGNAIPQKFVAIKSILSGAAGNLTAEAILGALAAF